MSKQLVPTYATEVEKLGLSPDQRALVRYYTDPLLPTYANKAASARAAGVDERTAYRWTNNEDHAVSRAIALVEAERDEIAMHLRKKLVHHAPDALREILGQLSLGRDLTYQAGDPEAEEEQLKALERAVEEGHARDRSGDPNEAAHKAILGRIQTRSKHNAEVTRAAKERRAAAELILEYSMTQTEKGGEPREGPAPLDLSELDDDQLSELGAAIEAVRGVRTHKAEATVEAEVVD